MKKTIAVIFGGRSAEHDVSIITAHTPIIESLLITGQYDVWPVYVAKDGSWYADQVMNDMAFFKNPDFESQLVQQKKIQLLFDNGLYIIWPGLRSRSVKIDIVFPAMHGTFGEDGSLMGLLRMAAVPFVGCDLAASAVAMDKVLTKQVIEAEHIPVVPYVWFTKAEWESQHDALMGKISKLTWPLFVKPVHLGSSIAMCKVKNETDLRNAIEVALYYDEKVLIEEAIEPLIELTLPMIGNDTIQYAHIERPLNKTEFFDFNDKYLSGQKTGGGVNSQYSEIPAMISDDLAARVREYGRQVYRILGCSGIARVDFLVNSNSNKLYVNEVNTLPGSLYAHNWRKAGVSDVELVSKLIALAEERFRQQQAITYTFSSNVLQQAGGAKL